MADITDAVIVRPNLRERVKSALAAVIAPVVKMLAAAPPSGGGWYNVIRESFPGAWQRGVTIDGPRDVLAFSGVFAPLTLIAADISKLRVKLVEEDADEICTELKVSAFIPVLRKPNHYQTRIQFWEQWILSKLLHGNTYALKGRESVRGMVNALYILDAQRVTPLVTESGDVYYELKADNLSGLQVKITVPASEIIHDRMNCLWHPLVGISPLYACAVSATQGRRIQSNSTKFFDNMSRPSGLLTSPDEISDEHALKLKTRWEDNYSGMNIGRTAVMGSGLKYESMTIPAQTSQLIEQLGWTKFDCADCFHMPHYKVGGPVPIGNTVEALQQTYYNDCLHALFESAELCLDEGLALPVNYYTEFDVDNLLRMDTAAQISMLVAGIKGTLFAPNEARAKRNLKAVTGGESPMAQHQEYSLAAIAKRDALADPFGLAPKPAPTTPEPDDDEDETDDISALADIVIKGLQEHAVA